MAGRRAAIVCTGRVSYISQGIGCSKNVCRSGGVCVCVCVWSGRENSVIGRCLEGQRSAQGTLGYGEWKREERVGSRPTAW